MSLFKKLFKRKFPANSFGTRIICKSLIKSLRVQSQVLLQTLKFANEKQPTEEETKNDSLRFNVLI